MSDNGTPTQELTAASIDEQPRPEAVGYPAAAGWGPSRIDAPPATATRHGGRRRRIAAGATVALLLSGVAAIAVLPHMGRDGSATAATHYKTAVMRALAPVSDANRALSTALATVDGRRSLAAEHAVETARTATVQADGALAALTAPAASLPLAAEARQALERETAYLAAVGTVLREPGSSSRNQLQTLQGDLTDALAAMNVGAGTVQGAERLTSWAEARNRAVSRHRARLRRQRQERRINAAEQAAAQAQAAADAARQAQEDQQNASRPVTACGDGLYVGSQTSCALGHNVRDEYDSLPDVATDVTAYSPVSDADYTFFCRPRGEGIRCDGDGSDGPLMVTWS